MHVLLQRKDRGNLSLVSVCFGRMCGERTQETDRAPREYRDMVRPFARTTEGLTSTVFRGARHYGADPGGHVQ